MLGSMEFNVGLIAAIIIAAIYIHFKRAFGYWKKRGVPTLNPSIPFGNFGDVFFSKNNPSQIITELYKSFKGHKVAGIYRFNKPSLLVRDPEVIKEVLVKEFDSFYHRGMHNDEKQNPMSNNLFMLSGSKWRNLRIKMSPTFTSGKMKMMFGTLVECGKGLQVFLEKPAENTETVEIKDILARYSTDIIASCAFGIECNCLKDPEAEFRKWGRKIFQPSIRVKIFRIMQLIFPKGGRFIRYISNTSSSGVGPYFRKMVEDTIEYREKNNVMRNDFMQLLIQLKNKTLGGGGGDEEVKTLENMKLDDLKGNAPFEVTMDIIAAQAFVFFLAGFETSSTTMTFCLYELALNSDIQERLREEIDSVLEKHDGNITYESIFEMEYLDKVVSETLRKHSPVHFVTRECTSTTRLKAADAVIEKGIPVMIPIAALHHDPQFFPDPQRFDPERFSEEEKKKRPNFAYLPFGEGPRLCIGMRFGLMQTKVGLVSILSKYEVQVSEKTPIPLVYDPKALVLSPLGGMWLKIVRRADRN